MCFNGTNYLMCYYRKAVRLSTLLLRSINYDDALSLHLHLIGNNILIYLFHDKCWGSLFIYICIINIWYGLERERQHLKSGVMKSRVRDRHGWWIPSADPFVPLFSFRTLYALWSHQKWRVNRCHIFTIFVIMCTFDLSHI